MNSKLQIWVSLCALLSGALTAAPVVSNVVASQRAESKLVDLTYDLSGAGASGARIAVELSDDSGASYTVSAPSLSGDLGRGISNGTGKQIVWDAGTDKPNFVSDSMRFRLSCRSLVFFQCPRMPTCLRGSLRASLRWAKPVKVRSEHRRTKCRCRVVT